MASNIQLFLGDKLITESYLGDKLIEYNISSSIILPPAFPIPSSSLDFWFDSSTYSGTGNWLSSFGNATASLFNVTKIAANGGTLDFQSSSFMEVTSSGVQPNYSTIPGAGFSIIAIAKASGSLAQKHDRLINGRNNNWLFGTYFNGSVIGWYNNNFVFNGGGTQDFKYKIYAGVNYTNASASMFVNGARVGGSTAGGQYGPNGIGINKGDYIGHGNPATGEYTYTMFNQLLVYSRALTDAELSQIFTYFSGSYL